MYYANGNVFLGQFINGRANGQGHYVFTDGSYYHGYMKDNQADTDDGEYTSDEIVYKGGFKDNMFHGKGEEKGKNH